YRNRGAQACEWSQLFAALAAAEQDVGRRSRYERGAEVFGRLADSLELRLLAYEPATRASRLAGLLRVLRRGGYGSRRRDGIGATKTLARSRWRVTSGTAPVTETPSPASATSSGGGSGPTSSRCAAGCAARTRGKIDEPSRTAASTFGRWTKLPTKSSRASSP